MSKVNVWIEGMFFACLTMAVVAFGCASNIEYPPLKQAPIVEGPHAPNKTIARLRWCVEEYGGDLGGRSFEFDYDVKVDEEGRAVSVTSDVLNADFDGCTRAALRAMEVPPELLLTWMSRPLARGDGQTNAARGLAGNVLVIVGVVVKLAPIIIEAAGVTILFTITLAIADEVIEAIRKYRPNPNLNRCLDAAAGGESMWKEFCRAVAEKLPDPYDAQECWSKTSMSEQEKRNWCRNLFGN
ncbi:hypothetical protein [Polyangium fumosum]|uniref:Lipoprotein n=1 Tax=Polyangium fumosum TaxID=889272 RepID=A0A4V5PQI0_9BACT|nr:hypothetical protein [Polyangium fumosum]TKC98528.1 hypothetical protein E8A74_40945 [Polyangium fumosum]